MLSREDRILSEILVSRGLVARERIEACAEARGESVERLADALVSQGALGRSDAEQAAEEARSIEESLVPELPAGRRLGEFRLLRELGRGGMGIVYEAVQEPLGRRVALKVLPGGAALDERLAIRFLREARAAARLSHPGIVAVHTSGRAEGVLYFAMELIEGTTLAERIAAGPLEPREAARIAAAVARALEHAHAAGLVHRDVKPENVLLSPDGGAKIADFGLVLETSAGALTLSHTVLGTPSYVAPEQARGESVDARSDIYGLGAVLYAMLAGSPPFPGEVPSLVLARLLTGRPRALASVRPELPLRLVAICERAMARDPAERHASAAAMAAELERFLAEPAAPEVAAPPRQRRRRRLLALAAAVPLAVTVWLLLSRTRPPGESISAAGPTPHAEFRPLLLGPGRKASPALSPDERWLVYTSDVDGDWDLWRVELPDGAPENLTPDSPLADVSPTFSPDGKLLAYVVSVPPAGSIFVLDLESRLRRKLAENTASGLRWSADGREILFSDRPYDRPNVSATASKLFALDVASGRVRALTGVPGTQPATSARSGAVVFVAQGGGRTDLWRLAPDGDATRVTDDEAIEWSPVWSLDGRYIYYGRDSGELAGLYRTGVHGAGDGPGEPVALSMTSFPAPFYLARGESSGMMVLAGVEHGGRLYRLDLDEEAAAVVGGHALPARFIAAEAPQIAPDGRQLVFTAVTSQEDLALCAADGSAARRVTDDPFLDRAPRWSPGGTRIAFRSDRSGTMEIWTIRPDGTGLERITEIGGVHAGPVWSPDGAWIAGSAEGRGAFLVRADGEGGAPALQPLPALPDGASFEPFSWSPDGKRLAGAAGRGLLLYALDSRRYEPLDGAGTHPVWIDARRLVYASERELHRLDTRTGETRSLLSFAPARVSPWLSAGAGGRSLWVSLSLSAQEIWAVEVRD
jgi:serine/threonine protein kinase